MSIEHYWETPLRTVARFSEKLLSLSFLDKLSFRVKGALSNTFWGYHIFVLVLIFLGPRFNVIESEVAKIAATPLIALRGVYFVHFIFIYIPTNGLYELYSYLRRKELPPSHSLLISVFTLLGVASILILILSE